MLLKILRNVLGYPIVFITWLTRPKAIIRNPEQQEQAQKLISGHSLYQLYACPFCVKTRKTLHRLNLNMDIRDIGKNNEYRTDLKNEGGQIKVPCLRIENGNEVRWMYESNDIIHYLKKRVTHLAS